VLAKIIHARPTNILILRKISLLCPPPPVAYSNAAAIAAFILATALSVSWRSGSPHCLLWYERESVNLDLEFWSEPKLMIIKVDAKNLVVRS